MKVCTDACVFGAHVAAHIDHAAVDARAILDIGTGTGLLSLMLAQKTGATIDAVEIDIAAAKQANENFEASPWKDRLKVFNADVVNFEPGKKYDCIIVNPPFYENDLRSPHEGKNKAMHELTLNLELLLTIIRKHLSTTGFFSVLLPYHRVAAFIESAANHQFYLQELVLLQHTSNHPWFRGILYFAGKQATTIKKEMAIKNTAGIYTSAFSNLLKDYYLYL